MKLDTLFNRINKDIFNNELEIPIFTYHYDPSMYGYHTAWSGQQFISILPELPWFLSAATMAHEMIHLWQSENGYKRNHGKRFKKYARKMEKYYNLRKGSIL